MHFKAFIITLLIGPLGLISGPLYGADHRQQSVMTAADKPIKQMALLPPIKVVVDPFTIPAHQKTASVAKKSAHTKRLALPELQIVRHAPKRITILPTQLHHNLTPEGNPLPGHVTLEAASYRCKMQLNGTLRPRKFITLPTIINMAAIELNLTREPTVAEVDELISDELFNFALIRPNDLITLILSYYHHNNQNLTLPQLSAPHEHRTCPLCLKKTPNMRNHKNSCEPLKTCRKNNSGHYDREKIMAVLEKNWKSSTYSASEQYVYLMNFWNLQ